MGIGPSVREPVPGDLHGFALERFPVFDARRIPAPVGNTPAFPVSTLGRGVVPVARL
jgi:hypothetical protein